jgi:flavin reductase (DIM6/NTAB) family NADH-FMN oxidoreductase RutF
LECSATGRLRAWGAIAAFECEVEEITSYQSHGILIGVVQSIKLADSLPPLLYWQGQFCRLEKLAE